MNKPPLDRDRREPPTEGPSESRAPSSETRSPTSWRIHKRRWLTLAGGYVLAFAVATGAVGCSLGGTDLSHLQPGQCITGDVEFYPPRNIEVIDCADADPLMDYLVVFTESATGNPYPGNLDKINARCQSEDGQFLAPSSDTWDDGDRVALCHKPPLMGSVG